MQLSHQQFGLPLHVYSSKCPMILYLNLIELPFLEKLSSGYLVGSSNFLLMNYPKIAPDCLINLDTGEIDISMKDYKSLLKLSDFDKTFYAQLCKVNDYIGNRYQAK